MKIRKYNKKDFKQTMNITRNLHPKWLDRFAIDVSIPLDLKIHEGFVAEEKNRILGFITYSSKEGAVELTWMGIDPKFHSKGIGRKLLNALVKELKKFNVKELIVETVADSVKYEPYESTRLFYKKMGFRL